MTVAERVETRTARDRRSETETVKGRGKELEKAVEHYSEVIMVDFGYRDAEARMTKLNEELGGSNTLGDLSDI